MLAAEEMAPTERSTRRPRMIARSETETLLGGGGHLGLIASIAVRLGFSEYASYASWVAANHRNGGARARSAVVSAPVRADARERGDTRSEGLRSTAVFRRASFVMKFLGYRYAGFEIGHVDACGLDDPKRSDAYGVWRALTTCQRERVRCISIRSLLLSKVFFIDASGEDVFDRR